MEFLQEISTTVDVSFERAYLFVSKPILNEAQKSRVSDSVSKQKGGQQENGEDCWGLPRGVGTVSPDWDRKARSQSMCICKGAIRIIPVVIAMCHQERDSAINDMAEHDTQGKPPSRA